MPSEKREVQRQGVGSSMARWRGTVWSAVLFLTAALLLAGCPKKPEVQTGAPGAAAGPGATGQEQVTKPGPMVEAPAQPGVKPSAEAQLKDVFFDFDKAILRDDAKRTLNNNIEWLKANPEVRIVVEGHCDERGTNEYNLGLGDRRAKAVRNFLVAGGVDAKRMSTISYGEERPFVLGHDESAWKWNRRGHFVTVK
ncbi:MAG: peptidoglycan-associated lipoprotein Pal [Candidatus Methylomirabilales bacterium]